MNLKWITWIVLTSLVFLMIGKAFAQTSQPAPEVSLGTAFRHYLAALFIQCNNASLRSYEETLSNYLLSLDRAEEVLQFLREKGMRGGDRNFLSVIDASRAAVQALDQTHGARLQRYWGRFS